MCRVSFPDKEAFERILPVLNVALASLHPLTDEQMFRALNAGSVKGELEWKDFQQRLESLAGFMVRTASKKPQQLQSFLGVFFLKSLAVVALKGRVTFAHRQCNFNRGQKTHHLLSISQQLIAILGK